MKTLSQKHIKTLDLLFQLSNHRQDNYLFSKISMLQLQKKIRASSMVQLIKLQQQRVKLQDKLLSLFDSIQLNESLKLILFQFSNKIYKSIKQYHNKLMIYSLKLSQIVDTNLFLTKYRQLTIDKLAEYQCMGIFLRQIINKSRERYNKEINICNINGHVNKIVDLIRQEENNKGNKYLMLNKEEYSNLYFKFYRNTIIQMDQQIQKLNMKKGENDKLYRGELYGNLLNLDENCYQNIYLMSNSIPIQFNYKEQGFCQFIIGKYPRLIKDYKSKNNYIQRQMIIYDQKYKNWCIKSRQNIRKIPKKPNKQRISKYIRSTIQHKTNNKLQNIQQSPIQIKNNTFFTQKVLNQSDLNVSEIQTQYPTSKKYNLFKINHIQPKKKSYTLRPLCQSKQNNKEIIHQKIIQMKLQDEPMRLTKILRIRKKRAFHAIRQQNVFGHIIKQNKINQFSFLLS